MDFLVTSAVEIGGYNEMELKFADAVKGARFEYLFRNKVEKLDFSVLRVRQTRPKDISINVRSRCIVSAGTTLSTLEHYKLYMLQPCHPSIDAVLCDETVVYLIQLSTMTYKDHKTDVNSLNMAFRNSSVLTYYKKFDHIFI